MTPHDRASGSSARLLIDRTFGPWFWGNVACNSGQWLFNVVAAVVVYQLSRSALLVGVVSAAQFVPMIVLAPITGALSDRHDRRRVLMWSLAISATVASTLAVLVLTRGVDGLGGAAPILLAAAGIGVGQAFAAPALNALVPALVSDADLERGVALTSLTFNLGRAAGPAVSGVVLASFGPEVAFAVHALSFVPLLAALTVIRPTVATDADVAHDRSARAGVRWVREHRDVLLLLIVVAAVGFAIDPIITLSPPLAEALGGRTALVSLLVTTFGLAAVPGALLSGRLQRRFGSLAVARAGAVAVALGLTSAALAPGPAVAVAGFAVCGTGFVLTVTSVTSLLQRVVPDALRGRVMALWSVAFLGSRPPAAVIDGAAADLVGPRAAMAIAVTIAIVTAILLTSLARRQPAWSTKSSDQRLQTPKTDESISRAAPTQATVAARSGPRRPRPAPATWEERVMPFELPHAASVAANPTQAQLRAWALERMPRITVTEFDNVNYQARILARLTPSTFFVSDHETGKQVMPRAEAERWAAAQDDYIADQDMVLIEGYVGPDPEFRTGTRLYMEAANSNVPAMQQQLYFERDDAWTPELTVIYTPGLRVPEHHEECLILVDLDNGVTRVFGSDYFGESKMGSLRMWNKLVYDRGGLAMHSGAKTFPAESTPDGQERLALIIGLSGTGKTTTTFRNVKGSLPVQDDFIALMPGGTVHTTENGCFAKSYGLDPDDEPTIHGGATRPDAWLESVAVDPDSGEVDFFDDGYTANGRVTFPLANIRHRDPRDLPEAHYLFILNRNENLIPAVAKLKPEQAAHYFMLGETKGTSAGGAHEAGKNLRVPGTNPFWFEEESSMGNRFLELLETCDLDVYLLNTGRVGGPDHDERSKKVRIQHSAAVQEAIVDGTITWEEDPDFGYLVAASLPGIDDDELLQPRKLYERQGRTAEYRALVDTLATERAEYLATFSSLDPGITKAG